MKYFLEIALLQLQRQTLSASVGWVAHEELSSPQEKSFSLRFQK